MMIRILIIVLIVLVGGAALTGLNPSADKTTNPIVKGLNTVRGWFSSSDALKLPGADKNETTVYKWQDATGEWHFSNQPPPAGTSSSVKTYRSDVNITQPPPPPVAPKPEPVEKAAAIPSGPAPLLPITDPGRVKQLIDDAQNVQKLVNERQQKLDEQLPQ
jgi:Domain of unknown function (DUF4124)